jgi:hypothetical protein
VMRDTNGVEMRSLRKVSSPKQLSRTLRITLESDVHFLNHSSHFARDTIKR